MATYSVGLGFNLNEAAYPAHTECRESIMEVVLDIPTIVAARLAAGATALVAGDVLEVIKLPAQCAVLAVGVAVEEASTGALTVDVGDAVDPIGYISAAPATPVSNGSSIGSGLGYAAGRYYSAADTIDVTFGGIAPVDGKIRIWAKTIDGAGYLGVSSIPGI
jgi:hypothetical protein